MRAVHATSQRAGVVAERPLESAERCSRQRAMDFQCRRPAWPEARSNDARMRLTARRLDAPMGQLVLSLLPAEPGTAARRYVVAWQEETVLFSAWAAGADSGSPPRSEELRAADRRQQLLPVALTHLDCYPPGVVASPRLLPIVATDGRQRWDQGSTSRRGGIWCGPSQSGIGTLRRRTDGAFSISSSRSRVTTASIRSGC
jgi:hypothetical protein